MSWNWRIFHSLLCSLQNPNFFPGLLGVHCVFVNCHLNLGIFRSLMNGILRNLRTFFGFWAVLGFFLRDLLGRFFRLMGCFCSSLMSSRKIRFYERNWNWNWNWNWIWNWTWIWVWIWILNLKMLRLFLLVLLRFGYLVEELGSLGGLAVSGMRHLTAQNYPNTSAES